MRREKRNYGSECELDWVRRYGGGQTDPGEILDDCCYVTSALGTLRSEVTLLHLLAYERVFNKLSQIYALYLYFFAI